MAYDKVIERDIDNLRSPGESIVANRVMAALKHPDCPVLVLEMEARRLSRFIAVRLHRQKGTRE